MSPEKIHPISYLATINASGSRESTAKDIMECVLHDGYALKRPEQKGMIDTMVNAKLMANYQSMIEKINQQTKEKILDNFNYLPRLACAYTVGFDKYGNTVLLLARKDLEKLERHLTPRTIDQIQRYHPKTGEIQKGIDGLIQEVDKKYALEQMTKEQRAHVEKITAQGTMERVCKLLGGKDDEQCLPDRDLLERSHNPAVYYDVLQREVKEESGWTKLLKPTPFAEVVEIKERLIKMCRIYIAQLGGEKGPKKFSESEIQQDLVEIYMPVHLAWMILHETFTAKVKSNDTHHRHKLSSCARSLLVMDYFKDHEKELMKLIK